jgi:ssDNA-binding Zn-finger/Zn-ribbon topoisomerase 1
MGNNTTSPELSGAASCSACGGCGMLPGKGPNDDVMNTPCPECNEWAKHDIAWQKSFITPIAREMKKRGVAYLLITIRDDGKAAFVIEPNVKTQQPRNEA